MDELKHLSCPFTWDMSSVTSYSGRILNRENERLSYWIDEDDNDFKNISLMKLMFSLMTSYEYTEDDKLEEAIKQIEVSEQIFIELESAPNGISIKAVDHILKGTKCFILQRMNKFSDIISIFKTIHPCHQDTVELGTLYGCRAIAWSFYFDGGFVEAIRNSEKAVQLDSSNGLWYFILGKGLRTERKCCGFHSKPNAREQKAFHSAFMLLCNAYIGTYHAHAQYESKNFVESKNVYTKILSMKPSEYDIYLKLALGFIRLKESDKADVCLKYLEEKVPSNPKYLHYKGLYLEKCKKDFEGAFKCFKESGSLCLYTADLTYLNLKMKVTKGNYSPIEYITNMLQRYQFCNFKMQLTYLQLASYYNIYLKDAKNSCKYYLKAIELGPKKKLLLSFQDFTYNPSTNIYDVLKNNIIPQLKSNQELDEITSEMLKQAEEAYKAYETHITEDANEKMTDK